MNIKAFLDDVKNFVIDLVLEMLETLQDQLRNITLTLTHNKKFWIYSWFIVFCTSSFVSNRAIKMISLLMFFAFFIAYRWEVGKFRHRAREKWKQKAKELKEKNK